MSAELSGERSKRLGYLRSGSEFAYPSLFEVGRYKQLSWWDNFYDRANPNIVGSGMPEGITLSPRAALLAWAESGIGDWQSRQTARYPTFHRDLPASLADLDDPRDPIELDVFRKRQLALMSHPKAEFSSVHRYGHQGIDFHPIGHMALVSVSIDELLSSKELKELNTNPFLARVVRYTAALHDTGESEHPGFQLLHGGVVGDIGADVGKTAADRQLERSILEDGLQVVFEGSDNDELIDAIASMASHDTEGRGEEFEIYHALLEINHEINSIRTAKHLSVNALKVAVNYPQHANLMSALAADTHKRRSNGKFQTFLNDHAPDTLKAQVNTDLEELHSFAHARDYDPAYIRWRLSDAAVQQFGEYEVRH